MAKFELKLPKMGESVAEATVTNWLKKVGGRPRRRRRRAAEPLHGRDEHPGLSEAAGC